MGGFMILDTDGVEARLDDITMLDAPIMRLRS